MEVKYLSCLQYNRKSILMVLRNGTAYTSPLEDIQNDHIYLGNENVLVLSQTYTTSFTCKYDMGAYPFDVQKCSMVFVLEVWSILSFEIEKNIISKSV